MNGYLERLVAQYADRPTVRSRAMSRFETRSPALPLLVAASKPSPQNSAEPWDEMAGDHPDPAPDTGGRSRRRPPSRGADGGRSIPVDSSPGRAEGALDRHAAAEAPASSTEPRRPLRDSAPAGNAPVAVVAAGPANDVAAATRSNQGQGVEGPSPARLAVRSEGRALPTVAVASRRDELAARRREPDVVQVHIGRVEVRAVVPAPEPSAPFRERPAAREPLSLERYLAGERRA
jgi:hypothetical protein